MEGVKSPNKDLWDLSSNSQKELQRFVEVYRQKSFHGGNGTLVVNLSFEGFSRPHQLACGLKLSGVGEVELDPLRFAIFSPDLSSSSPTSPLFPWSSPFKTFVPRLCLQRAMVHILTNQM